MSAIDFVKSWMLPPEVTNILRKALAYRFMSAVEKALLLKNLELANKHHGERCFILGAGSSIKQQDIRCLKGEYVISVSNTFAHADYGYIAPKYHVLPPILKGHALYYKNEEFVCWLQKMEVATQGAELFFHIGDKGLIESNELFEDRIIHWVDYCNWNGDISHPVNLIQIPNIWSVSELAITIALYMGFDKIYLVGFDHDWFNGPLVYFYNQEKEHELKPSEYKLKALGVDAEFQMRRHAEIFQKYKYLYSKKNNIFNANADKDSYVDTFPKVDFESLFDRRVVVCDT